MQALSGIVLAVSIGSLALFVSDGAAQQPASDSQQTPPGQVQITPPPMLGAPPAANPSQPTPSAMTPASGERRPGLEVDAYAVVGSAVRNAEGRDVGRVSRLMFDPREGRITTVVIGMGGTFGFGERQISVPWSAVRIGEDRQRIVVTVDQRLLEQAPRAEDASKNQPAASPATDAKNKK